jgi:lambda repressor-like predicted transcriptional regulator
MMGRQSTGCALVALSIEKSLSEESLHSVMQLAYILEVTKDG